MKQIKTEYFDKILNYINDYYDVNQTPPTFRDISSSLKIPTTTVSRYIDKLKESGKIESDEHRRLKTMYIKRLSGEISAVPRYDMVKCGETDSPDNSVLEYVKLPTSLFGSDDLFIVNAEGTSMTRAGIDEGDILVVRQTNQAKPGDIVIAMYDEGKTTCKFYDPDRKTKTVYLRAASDYDSDIVVSMENVVIQGVIIKYIKNPNVMKFVANEYMNGDI